MKELRKDLIIDLKELINNLLVISIFFAALYFCIFVFDSANPKPEIKSPKPTDCVINKRTKVYSPKSNHEKSSKPTALCRDGSVSYSLSRRGTCSWHKGVAKWLR